MPRRMRYLYYSGDPPAICHYSTTFLSITRRLLFSRDELAREVRDGASPLRRFLSLSGLALTQPKLTERTEKQLQSLLYQACRAEVRRDYLTEEFLDSRDYSHIRKDKIGQWQCYQKNRERRHYWGQALCCHYDWNWDLSRSLQRLFSRPKQHLIRLSEMQDDGRVNRAFKCSVPEVLTVEYTDEKGEIRYKTFLAACHSAEDVTRRDCASAESTPISSTPEELVAGSSSSESRLEYMNVLEYREINRHARRKTEAWLNDGWSVEWEWNGLYNYKTCDSRWKGDSDEYRPAYRMTLRRSKANLSSSTSGKNIGLKFPKTPNPPPDPNPYPECPAVYLDN